MRWQPPWDDNRHELTNVITDKRHEMTNVILTQEKDHWILLPVYLKQEAKVQEWLILRERPKLKKWPNVYLKQQVKLHELLNLNKLLKF